MDPNPEDNYGVTNIIAKPSPYKIWLQFEDETRIDYIGLKSGEKVKSKFIVTNLGGVDDTITFTTSSMPGSWTTTFNTSSISLRPGQTAHVKIEIKTVKDNKYYNYGVDVIGTSQGGAKDKILLFISFTDVIAKGGGDINISGNITPVDPGPGPGPQPPDPPPDDVRDYPIQVSSVQVAAILVVGICVFITVVAVYQLFIMGSKISMKSILKDLYKNLYKVDTSDAYRKAIFKAYKKMCEELEDKGHGRKESITPKEFEKYIREYLPINKKDLHTLTKLFEEARYSDHAFNEKKKRRALKALKGIIRDLEEITTFEDVPEKKSWFRKNT
jgi:hypothetical protein